MKRIDEKIQEIEKKDKQSRGLYIGFVVLIICFMGVVLFFTNKIEEKNKEISDADIRESKLFQKVEASNLRNEALVDSLQNSLKPEQYWEHVNKEQSVESYIEFLTNIWGIGRKSEDMDTAKSKIQESNTIGMSGWVYVGNETENGPFTKPTKGQIAKIIWRQGQEEQNELAKIVDTKPVKYDIIKLVKATNRITYENANFNSTQNDEGWRPSSKAFIYDIKNNDAEVWVRIKYY